MNNVEDLQKMMDSRQNPEKAKVVKEALAQLSRQERSCLLLHIEADFTQEEIAEILELDQEAVEKVLQHACQQFWEMYTSLEGRKNPHSTQNDASENLPFQGTGKEKHPSVSEQSFFSHHLIRETEEQATQRREQLHHLLEEISTPDLLPNIPEQVLQWWETQSKVDYLQDVVIHTQAEEAVIQSSWENIASSNKSYEVHFSGHISVNEELQGVAEQLNLLRKFFERCCENQNETRLRILNCCSSLGTDFDDVLQNVLIKLWIHPQRSDASRDLRSLVCQEVQKEFFRSNCRIAIMGQTGTGKISALYHYAALRGLEKLRGEDQCYSSFLYTKSDLNDPQVKFEQKIEVSERLDQVVDAVLMLPIAQRIAMVCALKEKLDDPADLVEAFKKREVDITEITWPVDVLAKQRLQTAYYHAQKQLAYFLNINLSKYTQQDRNAIGNYTLVKEIASSSCGSMYFAYHKNHSDWKSAVKVFSVDLSFEKDRIFFLQKVKKFEELKHPHILSVIDGGIEGKTPYLVREYAPGGSLRDFLIHRAQRPLPLSEAITILLQIGQALQFLHQKNIIHQDIKPENILFNEKGEALIADFGVATTFQRGGVKQHIIRNEKLFYMAPEQFQGIVSQKSDQYALACVTYELLAGQKPFVANEFALMKSMHLHKQPPSLTQLNPLISSSVERTVLKALEKQEDNRYKDILSFIKALFVPLSPVAKALQVSWSHISNTQSKMLEQWVQTGVRLYQMERFEEAIEIYEQIILLNPSYAPAYSRKGDVLFNLHRHQEALDAYEKALHLDKTIKEAHHKRGDILFALGKYREALTCYEQVIKLDPYLVFAYNGKGNSLYALKQYEKALAVYEQALLLSPSEGVLHFNKGKVLEQLGEYKEAFQACRKARRFGYTVYSTKEEISSSQQKE